MSVPEPQAVIKVTKPTPAETRDTHLSPPKHLDDLVLHDKDEQDERAHASRTVLASNACRLTRLPLGRRNASEPGRGVHKVGDPRFPTSAAHLLGSSPREGLVTTLLHQPRWGFRFILIHTRFGSTLGATSPISKNNSISQGRGGGGGTHGTRPSAPGPGRVHQPSPPPDNNRAASPHRHVHQAKLQE